jgi:hypothetical protein
MNYNVASRLRIQPTKEPLVLFHMTSAISHPLGPSFG